MHVDLTVVLGRKRLPLHQLLRMKRGAVVDLDAGETDDVEILANGHPIARGQVAVRGSAITVEITALIEAPGSLRDPGISVGACHVFTADPTPPHAQAA